MKVLQHPCDRFTRGVLGGSWCVLVVDGCLVGLFGAPW